MMGMKDKPQNKDPIAVVWCKVCDIVLGRFDWSDRPYEDDDFD